ncbi:YybH family protein [Aporhodopirellula aestuarii]|uniref:SgcJ/EcaC family oxidoreductase n=1 Tax=Aporhodopirellula aestuarii TaxID=2950107 RepID=A0ABT0UBZ6_9BACT|nr:SgcJ/EcaC family oxidoreductase [Aporhodopirellula aestuarii]MCM2374386.1 SgcJ/EcaC family oxidoreductase [Aporhodopirellula aestuarii]
MTYHIRLISLLVAVNVGVGMFADEPASRETKSHMLVAKTEYEEDLAAIRAQSVAFENAFYKRDAKAIAAFCTEDGEFVDEAGVKFVGRDEIEQSYVQLFADSPDVSLRIVIDSLRLLSEIAVMEDGRAVVDPAPTDTPGFSKYEVVHVKVDGKWLMALVRDTWVESKVSRKDTADLGGLIGQWVAEEHGNRIEADFGWVADESFVERSYTTTRVDGTTISGVQLIGWNPREGCVESWDFSGGGSSMGSGISGAEADAPADGEWLPLGVFAPTKTAGTRSDVSIQLAVNKEGIIRGSYTDTATGETQVVQGAVDQETQRLVFSVGSNQSNLIETGLYNLTKDEAPALIHFGSDKTEQWLLVSLKNNQLAAE